jgi:type III secretion system FlhB-like substrate exporter
MALSDEAQRTADLAERFHIPLPEDAGVVAALSRPESNAVVSPELYAIIASVIAFVQRLDRKAD